MTAHLTPRNIVIALLLLVLALVPVYSLVSGNAFAVTLFTRIVILALLVGTI